MKNILEYPKKTITLVDLEIFLGIKDYKKLWEAIEEMVETGRLKEVNPKVTNGKNPPLAKKYRILQPQRDDETYLREMKSSLPTRFSIDYYRDNVEKYTEHREYILPLANYFNFNQEALKDVMAINERSFDIWRQEKFLKDSLSTNILKNLGLTIDDLNVYYTPEPFFYYSVSRLSGQNILIIENKDTWYSMRKLMKEGQNNFFGIEFGTIIYGEGKKIISSFRELDNYSDDEKFLGYSSNKFYYFGDLDYEGLSIYQSLKKEHVDKRDITLLKEAYCKMIEKANIDSLKFMKKEQIRKSNVLVWKEVVKELEVELQNAVTIILEQGKYIPQEIINFQQLKEGEHSEIQVP